MIFLRIFETSGEKNAGSGRPLEHYADHAHELAQIHCLRANVFRGRLEWDVTVTEAGKFDEYDKFDPTYILAIADSARVVGCARLLPTQRPTMLGRTFSQLRAIGLLGASSTRVERSRFCVDTTTAEPRGGAKHYLATLTMFAGIIEWSMANGYDEIVTATDLHFEWIINRADWPMIRHGGAKGNRQNDCNRRLPAGGPGKLQPRSTGRL